MYVSLHAPQTLDKTMYSFQLHFYDKVNHWVEVRKHCLKMSNCFPENSLEHGSVALYDVSHQSFYLLLEKQEVQTVE